MSILKEMEQHGAYAQLSNGKVRYEFAGPESGDVVVLIHGLIGHMHVFDYQFKFLIEQGYRVLRFDLYGRGFSERVKGEHGSELFMAQVSDLIEFVVLEFAQQNPPHSTVPPPLPYQCLQASATTLRPTTGTRSSRWMWGCRWLCVARGRRMSSRDAGAKARPSLTAGTSS